MESLKVYIELQSLEQRFRQHKGYRRESTQDFLLHGFGFAFASHHFLECITALWLSLEEKELRAKEEAEVTQEEA